MKIENLKCFLAVVRTGSLHKAAEELFLTPQNLGLIIKSLEKEIGEDLFLRTPKGMRLNAEGENFLPYAQELVDVYEQYFSGRKKTTHILNFYTTPALAKEVRELQDVYWGNQYYLSVQKKSPNDLKELLSKGAEGIYFLCLPQQSAITLKRKKAVSLFKEQTRLIVCHRSHPLMQCENFTEDVLKKCLVISGETYNGESYNQGQSGDNLLYIDDTTLCKKLMREKDALHRSLSHLFYKNFQEPGEWCILQSTEVPVYEFILIFNVKCEKNIEKEIELCMKQLFVANT